MNYFNQAPDHLFLREGTTYIKIPLSEIDYIQADGNYAYLQTKSKRFAVKRSLAAISEELHAPEFLRLVLLLLRFSSVVTNLRWAKPITPKLKAGCPGYSLVFIVSLFYLLLLVVNTHELI